jgi:NAD(P)-dependent dehydrogenase (short-subunit alcohol dehydrogenase family)
MFTPILMDDNIVEAYPAPKTPGQLNFPELGLNDPESVKRAAAIFAQKEYKLLILWNSAGTGANMSIQDRRQRRASKLWSACIAFQHCCLADKTLLSQLQAASRSGASGSTRMVWTSSFLAEGGSPPKGVDFRLPW